jgi:deoxyribonuclease V
MILAVDVDYKQDTAVAGGILFEDWTNRTEHAAYRSHIDGIVDYIPGEFWRRELPCILRLLEEHALVPDSIVIDGFVYLDGVSRPGLGKYLFDFLGAQAPVIGVAKSKFVDTPEGLEVVRGRSQSPLYVTSVGIPLATAKQFILSMYGEYRIPYLLKKADQIARGIEIAKHRRVME